MIYKPDITNYLVIKCQDIQKLFVTLSYIQRHSTITIERPKWLKLELAEEISDKILKKEQPKKATLSALTYSKQRASTIISHIKNVRPPGQVLVITEKYHKAIFEKLEKMYKNLPIIEEYKMPRK